MIELGVALGIDSTPASEIIEAAKTAEYLGYGSVWVSNSRSMWDPYAIGAAAAMRTSAVNIGVFVADPYTQHPLLIARSAASLQRVSGGRALLGIGAGGTAFEALNIVRTRPVETVRTAVDNIRTLLSGAEMETGEGRRIRLDPTVACPVPIIVAARGRNMLRTAGQRGDGVIISHHMTRRLFKEARDLATDGAGNRGVTGCVYLRADVCICSSEEEALSLLRPSVALSIGNSWSDDDLVRRLGITTLMKAERRRLYEWSHSLEDCKYFIEARISDMMVRQLCWIGGAEQVASIAREVGCDQANGLIMVFHVAGGRSLRQDMTEFAAAFRR